jgi:AcrR family transcriptional regulator
MTPRAPRADALRNRTKILAAASDAFARDGAEVPLDTIAELAGVGAGTVHRHFPTKESLIDAVVAVRLDTLADRADDVRAQPAADFFGFLVELAEAARSNVVLASVLGGTLSAEGNQAATRLTQSLAQLLTNAQRSGQARPDLTVSDLHAAIAGAITIEQRLPNNRHGLGVEIVLAGLRPPTQPPAAPVN